MYTRIYVYACTYRNDPSDKVILGQYDYLKEVLQWDPSHVSKRVLFIDNQPISGHSGEWLGCLVGAYGALVRIGQLALAQECESIIDGELSREAKAFDKLLQARPGAQADTFLLKLAAVLTHNVGDVDQGYAYSCGPSMYIHCNSIYTVYYM